MAIHSWVIFITLNLNSDIRLLRILIVAKLEISIELGYFVSRYLTGDNYIDLINLF